MQVKALQSSLLRRRISVNEISMLLEEMKEINSRNSSTLAQNFSGTSSKNLE